MATIKSFTSLEQSKKLAKILPLDSADMYYAYYHNPVSGASYYEEYPMFYKPICNPNESVPCWSLAALLKCLSEIKLQVHTTVLFQSEGKWILRFVEYGHGNVCEVCDSDPVDACVAMIEKLHELKML